MMEILKDFPDNVLAAKASGQVTKKDYDDVLIPAVSAAFARHKELRCYYAIGPGLAGFDMGAMWEDFMVGIGHWTGWERVAVVTDVEWIKHAVNAFGLFMPCPVKLFAPTEAAQVRAWIAA
jgi:hypothetical protein